MLLHAGSSMKKQNWPDFLFSWSLKSNECVWAVEGKSGVLQRVPGDAALYMVAYFVWGFDVRVCLF